MAGQISSLIYSNTKLDQTDRSSKAMFAFRWKENFKGDALRLKFYNYFGVWKVLAVELDTYKSSI